MLLAVHLSTWIQSVDWVGTPVPYKSVGQFLISARGAEGTQPWPKADKPHCKKRINRSSLGRYVFGSEISYNKAPPRLPGLGC